ncbi:MAG: cell division protein FtsH, partial [Candidatus Dormibacteraeota bacterium]|nr:cell division protein FtsH [Candidatus Dormibacteraeota bacterium]
MVVGLLALNLWISSQALQPNAPVRIPYSPTFLAQVRAGNVKEIASTGDAIQGTLNTGIRYPANDKTVAPSTNFATQVPSFANNAQLESLLQNSRVTIDAKSPNTGPSTIESLIFGFGPTLLLFAIIFIVMRRAAASGGAGGLMSFGRSRARRVEASDQHITFEDVAGID